MIRPVSEADAQAVCDIYNYYVTDTIVTFEEEKVPVEEMKRRILETTAAWPWLVLERDRQVVGYAYASRWKARSAYRFAAETTVYLDVSAIGNGFGSRLYERLIGELQKGPLHALVAGIALPNKASVALHENFGFGKVAHFSEVGRKFDQWIDVGYWERIL